MLPLTRRWQTASVWCHWTKPRPCLSTRTCGRLPSVTTSLPPVADRRASRTNSTETSVGGLSRLWPSHRPSVLHTEICFNYRSFFQKPLGSVRWLDTVGQYCSLTSTDNSLRLRSVVQSHHCSLFCEGVVLRWPQEVSAVEGNTECGAAEEPGGTCGGRERRSQEWE